MAKKSLAAKHKAGIADARRLDNLHGDGGYQDVCDCMATSAHISAAEWAALEDAKGYLAAGDETRRLWLMKDGSAFWEDWYGGGAVLRRADERTVVASILSAGLSDEAGDRLADVLLDKGAAAASFALQKVVQSAA